jgi:hypothetical protein
MEGTNDRQIRGAGSGVIEFVAIALPQLVLWYDSTRIQTWPSLMAQVDNDCEFRSTRAFAKEYCTDRLTHSGHSAADNVTKNLPGLEAKNSRLVLRGIGLLEKATEGYRISKFGSQLGTEYRKDPAGKSWVVTLGTLLLTREPRTRVLIRLLSVPGAELYFTDDEWWGGSIARATINYNDGRQILPFSDQKEHGSTLREVIKNDAWWALGEWRSHDLLQGASNCEFVGQSQRDFSLHAVSVALRASCEVMLHLGVIQHRADRCWLDHDVAFEVFGAAIAEDFGWEPAGRKKSLLEWLVQFVDELRLDTGFIVASELRDRLRKQGFDNPDREIARLESEGRVVIEATDYGQSRHGVGLYDDPRKQLIKLRVS